MPADVVRDLVRDSVEDGGEGDVVLLGGAQQVPGQRVGVAGGGGDQDPDVGRADQLGGEFTVAGDQGVDVGGVEEGQAARERVVAFQPEFGPGGLAAVGGVVVAPDPLAYGPGARQPGQHARVGEPGAVLGMAHQHRRTGGGAQDTRFADTTADKRVDKSRLARACRSADDREQRRLGRGQPRYQVVVQLGQEFLPGAAGAAGSGQREGEARGLDAVAQRGQRVDQLWPYVQDRHNGRMPHIGAFTKRISGN